MGYLPYIPSATQPPGIAMAPSCCRTASALLRCDGTAPRRERNDPNKNGGDGLLHVTPFYDQLNCFLRSYMMLYDHLPKIVDKSLSTKPGTDILANGHMQLYLYQWKF